MAIKAFPLNQQEYSYNAQDVMKYYAGRNSGVFETGENLKVSANGGLEIRVNSGMGWLSRDYVASVAFWNESVEYLMVDAGHDTYDRIDLVVVSWNFIQQEQNPTLIIRKGTPASSPAVPSLVNNSSTIEIALARINVGKGDIELSDSDIVDLRGNDTYCPMVYDEQTIREAFRKCVGFADGVNKISDFPSVTPASSDKILIEQGGEGKSATLADLPIPTKVQSSLDTKINKTDALTYEEIMASNPPVDLNLAVAKASAVKDISETKTYNVAVGSNTLIFRKVGKIVSVYGSFANMDTAYNLASQTPTDVAPKYNYSIVNVYSTNPPYNVIGTLWVGASGAVNIYKPSSTTDCFIYGTYTIA